MRDVRVVEVAGRQHRCVSWRQLRRLGMGKDAIQSAVSAGWLVRIYDGAYAVAPVGDDPRTRWMAATLTSPRCYLSHASAGIAHGIWRRRGSIDIVTRPGSGGPEMKDGLRVHRSATLDGDTTVLDGIPITTVERTILDLTAHVGARAVARMVREAIRLKLTTAGALLAVIRKHRGRRGTRVLHAAVARYAGLSLHHTRSDPEALAITLLTEAGLAPDDHNVPIEGLEADLIWHDRRLIVELDGPQYHLDTAHDEAKQRTWEQAGWTVRRVSTDDVYAAPERLRSAAADG